MNSVIIGVNHAQSAEHWAAGSSSLFLRHLAQPSRPSHLLLLDALLDGCLPLFNAPQLVSKGPLRSFNAREGQSSVFSAEVVDEQARLPSPPFLRGTLLPAPCSTHSALCCCRRLPDWGQRGGAGREDQTSWISSVGEQVLALQSTQGTVIEASSCRLRS